MLPEAGYIGIKVMGGCEDHLVIADFFVVEQKCNPGFSYLKCFKFVAMCPGSLFSFVLLFLFLEFYQRN